MHIILKDCVFPSQGAISRESLFGKLLYQELVSNFKSCTTYASKINSEIHKMVSFSLIYPGEINLMCF